MPLLAILGLAALPAAAQAAPPPNDDRVAAQAIPSVPATVRGTTVDATLEPDEPASCRGQTKGSVYYAFRSGVEGPLVLTLDAAGDLDAVVDVYRRTRSQLMPVDCGLTDKDGDALLELDLVDKTDYVVRVAPLANSVADGFTLGLVRPDAPERPPGTALPAGGVDRTLRAVINPDDAFSASFRAGVTYRINLVSSSEDGRVTLGMYGPGIRSFSGSPVRSLRGTDYTLFTPGPGEGGRYTLQARAARRVKGDQPYHLQVARAGEDDTAPGRLLANDRRITAVLEGNKVDTVDLYRFSVARRSDLNLSLQSRGASFELELLTDSGRRVATRGEEESELTTRLRPGRYFVAVRASNGRFGRYTLRRLSRTITSTRVLVDGRGRKTVRPGATVRLGTRVRPAVGGPVTLVVERFDPLAGWQFARRYRVRTSAGTATVGFTPDAVGRWRVRATFEGTRGASPSASGFARFLVARPLRRG